jgi:O-antigen/teichoic acid export membrane protein
MLFRNTLAQSAGMLVGNVFSFILAPFMIARLGLDAFGVWAVTGAFATYAGLLDLGIGRSLSRFIAVYDLSGDEHRIRECVGLGLVAVALLGLLAAVAAAAAAPLLSEQLGVLGTDDMRVVVLASVAIMTFNGFSGVLNAVGLGKRRMVPPNVAATIGAGLYFTFSVAALAASSSLTVYAVANGAASLVAIGPTFFAMRYLWHAPYSAVPSRELVKKVLPFGLKNQIGALAYLVNLETDKVIIAFIIDVRAAATFEIASRVVVAVRNVALLTVSAMIPTMTARIVEEGHEVISEIYRRYTLRTCAVAFPLFMVTSVSAPFLLIAWLGSAPGDAALLVPFLTLAYFVNITTAVGTQTAIGAGYPGMASAEMVLIAVLNVVFTVVLAPLFGLWGVAAGTFLAVTLGSVLFNIVFLRRFRLPARELLAGVLPTGALAIGLAFPPALLAVLVGTPDGRLPAAFWLAVSVAIYGLPYWLIATRRGFLPEKLEFPPWRRHSSVKLPAKRGL